MTTPTTTPNFVQKRDVVQQRDLLIQRVITATLLALAASLACVGLFLYV